MHFKDREVNMLLRALQPNLPVEDREVWWSEIRACRLRQVTDWRLSPLRTLFTVSDEYFLLQYRAYIARIRGLLKQRKMGLLDAFRLFDCDRNGVLSYEEWYGGITWLGLGDQCSGQQVMEMCENMDHDKDGSILYVDFVRHLKGKRTHAQRLGDTTQQTDHTQDGAGSGGWTGLMQSLSLSALCLLVSVDLNEELEQEEKVQESAALAVQQNSDLAWLGLDFSSPVATSSSSNAISALSTQDNSAWMELIAGSTGTEHHAAWKEQYGDIKPRVLFPEKSKSTDSSSDASQRDLKARIFKAAEKIRIEVTRVGGYTHVWESKGSMSRTKVSVWAGSLLKNKNYRASVNLGHYATSGFGKPEDKNAYITVSDASSVLGWFKSKSCYLILNALCPHPIKYRQVWMTRGGEKSLYAWEATPPSKEFVALSHIFTSTPDEPSLTEMRCVPRVWCVPATIDPKCIWDDAGGGGRRGSIWVINSLGMVCVVEGHEKPKGKDFFDLAQTKFMATLNLDKMRWDNEAGAASSSGGGMMDSKWKASLDSWMADWEEDEVEQEKMENIKSASSSSQLSNPFDIGEATTTVVQSKRALHVAANYASYALAHNSTHTPEEKDLFVRHHGELQSMVKDEASRASAAAQSHVELKSGDVNQPTAPVAPNFCHPTAATSYTADWLPRNNEVTSEIDAKYKTLANAPPVQVIPGPPPKAVFKPAPALPEIAAPVSSIGRSMVAGTSYGAQELRSGGFGSYGASAVASLGSQGAPAAGSSYAAPTAFVPPAAPVPMQTPYHPPPSSGVSAAANLAASTGRRPTADLEAIAKRAPSPSNAGAAAADAAAFAGMSIGGKPPTPTARKPSVVPTSSASSKQPPSAEDMFALMNVKAAPAVAPSPMAAPAKPPTPQPSKAPSPMAKPAASPSAALPPLIPAPSTAASQPDGGLALLPGLDFGAPPAKSAASSSSFNPLAAGSMLLGDAPLPGLGPMTLAGPGGLSKAKSASGGLGGGNDLDIFSGMSAKAGAASSSSAAASSSNDLDIFGLSPAAATVKVSPHAACLLRVVTLVLLFAHSLCSLVLSVFSLSCA